MCRLAFNTSIGFLYVVQNELFAGPLLCLTFSIANFVSRTATLFAPFVAEADVKVAQITLLGVCVSGILASAILRFGAAK